MPAADKPPLIRLTLEVTVQPEPIPGGPPWWVDLRRMLKCLGRHYRMRCTAIYGVRKDDRPADDSAKGA